MLALASIFFSISIASHGRRIERLAPSLAEADTGRVQDSSRELERLLLDMTEKPSRQVEARVPSKELASLLLSLSTSAGWVAGAARTRQGSYLGVFSSSGRSCRDFALSERLTVLGKRFLSPELNELRDEVEHTELIEQAIGNDKKVVIKFLARWCPSCRSMKRKLEVVAKEYPEFDFYSMDYDKNKELAKSLNITRLPYLEVIDGSRGLAGSFACGRSDLPYLKETLSSLVDEDLR